MKKTKIKPITLEDVLIARNNLETQLNLYKQAEIMGETPPCMDLWIKFFERED